MFPDEGLERLLHLVENLSSKISTINTVGFLDASVLGEEVNPRSFNTLRRIREEDNAVIEEQESFIELASGEALLRQLQQQLADAQMREWLQDLPDGIHSGLLREGQRGVFFYFTAPGESGTRRHFWRYYDLDTRQVIDNRLLIANLIQCQPDTPRYIPTNGVNIFEVQEAVIEDILRSAQEQQALEAAPKRIDPIQQTIITTLRGHLSAPGINRAEMLELIKALSQPLPNVHVRALRQSYEAFQAQRSIEDLMTAVRDIRESTGAVEHTSSNAASAIKREDLHLVCFEYVWS